MSWETIVLGDVIHVKHGFAFQGNYFADSGDFVLLTPGHCQETGGFRSKADSEKYFSGDFPPEFLLSEGDLLVVMTDLINRAPILGGSFIVPCDNRYLHNQRLGLVTITDENRIDGRFLYHLMNTREYRAQVRGSASGATVRHTSPSRIKLCRVRIPCEIGLQRRIADLLFAYDDLIENNRRRIFLLEEAARQLYREWFVRLRFPGNEHAQIVDGVPRGWNARQIGDSLTLNYGKALKADDRVEGRIPVFGSSGVVGFHDKSLCSGPGIIVGRKGNVGSVYWSAGPFYAIDTVYFVSAEESDLYLYYALSHTHFMSTDVAVPGLNRDFAYSRTILIPDHVVLREFLDVVSPLHAQMATLEKANQKLRAARDLLLPRLMNGEIEV